MSWSGQAKPVHVEVQGERAMITFSMPIDKPLAEAVIACSLAGERSVLLALFPETAEVDPAEVDGAKLEARANQTSWGQSLKEKLTGAGPKQKKE